ncbi:DUF6197 family protein [Mycolicibacterium phlei]|uniref:DUF6197 family protein n=1 Tax=Mycolicibacterium phlei TaxID=1771 RepID=UPI0002D7A0C9|nr:hypothetical protein [Mycolicibacterium phlei]MBF4194563.1 hypothetical protein [Mycolicibacterium phlei]
MLATPDTHINQVISDLHSARSVIETFGLRKRGFGITPGGPACIVGALIQGMEGHFDYTMLHSSRLVRAVYALAATLGKEHLDEVKRREAIYKYNDHPDTTKEDVLGLIDTTIANLLQSC